MLSLSDYASSFCFFLFELSLLVFGNCNAICSDGLMGIETYGVAAGASGGMRGAARRQERSPQKKKKKRQERFVFVIAGKVLLVSQT